MLVRPGDAGPPISFAIDGVQPDVATVAARHLYGLDDPEEDSEGSRLPIGVNLGAVVGWAGDVDGMITRWGDPPEGLTATVGMTENGPMLVDLVAEALVLDYAKAGTPTVDGLRKAQGACFQRFAKIPDEVRRQLKR